MTTVQRVIEASPTQIWAHLADGWSYATWVVGAAHVRDVDDGYPAPGTRLHHSVGGWPLLIDDTTLVLERDVEHRLVLKARGWPAGEARVTLELRRQPDGSTRVVLDEVPVSGPGRWVDNPALRFVLRKRNEETLARLADLAERAPVPVT